MSFGQCLLSILAEGIDDISMQFGSEIQYIRTPFRTGCGTPSLLVNTKLKVLASFDGDYCL